MEDLIENVKIYNLPTFCLVSFAPSKATVNDKIKLSNTNSKLPHVSPKSLVHAAIQSVVNYVQSRSVLVIHNFSHVGASWWFHIELYCHPNK